MNESIDSISSLVIDEEYEGMATMMMRGRGQVLDGI